MLVSRKTEQSDRTGEWLPYDHRAHKEWLAGVIDHVGQTPKELHPVVQEFKDLIEKNTRVWLLFSSMFEQIPNKEPCKNDPGRGGHPTIRDHSHMLKVINHLLTTAPSWNDKSERVGLVGLPFNALFDWPMGTVSTLPSFSTPRLTPY